VSLTKRAEFRQWRLVLAGEGPDDYVASLKRMVAERDADELVIFPGWLEGEHKEAALRNASLLALASHQENFGLCVMESLACGVPVLISPHVDLAPEIEAAGAGWVAGVNKTDILAKLTEALNSDTERSRRGEAGKKLSTKFTWDNVSLLLSDMY